MNDVAQFPSRLKAYEAAAAWLARLDRGVSAEEQAEFQRWLEREPGGRRAFVELAVLWDEAQVLSSLAGSFPLKRRAVAPERRRTRAAWVGAAIASAVLVLVVFFVRSHFAPTVHPNVVGPRHFAAAFHTEIGSHASEDLPDGSMVTLNTNTALDVKFTAKTRDVYLRRGEALFEVAHDRDHPFDVHAGDHVVRAVGTAFDVRLDRGGAIQVVVAAGRVKVARAEAKDEVGSTYSDSDPPKLRFVEAVLVKGEALKLAPIVAATTVTPQVMRLKSSDIDVKLAWQRGMLIFRGERLKDVLAEFGRYTTLQFVLADPKLSAVRVGGYFQAGDVDGLLTALRENFDIESKKEGDDRIVLREAAQ